MNSKDLSKRLQEIDARLRDLEEIASYLAQSADNLTKIVMLIEGIEDTDLERIRAQASLQTETQQTTT